MEDVSLIASTFTAQERDYIRRELDMFFSTFKSLMDRGLMQLDLRQRLPRVFFTPAGLM